jgi:hypothetical protein
VGVHGTSVAAGESTAAAPLDGAIVRAHCPARYSRSRCGDGREGRMPKRRAVVTIGTLARAQSSVPLYRQLYDGLREAILSGQLQPRQPRRRGCSRAI